MGLAIIMLKIRHKSLRFKIIVGACLFILLALASLFIYLNSVTYQPSEQALSDFQSDSKVRVTEVKDGYKFEPTNDQQIKEPNIIFYPGGLVEPISYSPLARELAKFGHRVYIANMPLNFSFFGQNKADSFLAEYPKETYVIGGHSLGGVFASRYAVEHTEKLKGVFFLASYADEDGALKDTNLSALQLTGTNDGVLNKKQWENSKKNLPKNTTYVSINGGNHGQFGSYGMQKGDHKPTISESKQIETTVMAMEEWFIQMNITP